MTSRRAGFQNKGNTLFVSSTLQLLLRVRPLCEAVHRCPDPQSLAAVVASLQRLHEGAAPVDPTPLLAEMDSIKSTLKHGRQKDAHEFMDALLESLDIESGKEIANIFCEQFILQVSCTVCDRISTQRNLDSRILTVQKSKDIQCCEVVKAESRRKIAKLQVTSQTSVSIVGCRSRSILSLKGPCPETEVNPPVHF